MNRQFIESLRPFSILDSSDRLSELLLSKYGDDT